jgi:hypothetical protein
MLAYKEPAGPYHGLMKTMAAPRLRGLGKCLVRRGDTTIASGQEYRGITYGHLNLQWRDYLVLAGQKVDANNWPRATPGPILTNLLTEPPAEGKCISW